ncbi:putative repeat protein (TIGR01451 family)/fimbrial isopeptide formation D2 family protein, partial [Hoeflea marina]
RTILVTLKDPIPDGITKVRNRVVNDCIITDAVTGAPCEVNPPTPPKVTVAKTLSGESNLPADGIVQAGETLTYDMVLTNSGGSDVTGYVVTDRFDANTSFVAASDNGAGGSFDTSNTADHELVWTGTVPAGGTVTLTITVKAADSFPDGVTEVVNLCLVDSIERCRVSNPPQGSVVPTKELVDEIGAVKDEVAQPGETLVYEVTVTHTGGAAVNDYRLTDRFLQVDAIASISSSDGGVSDASTGITTWTIDTIPVGGVVTRQVSVTLKAALPVGLTEVVNLTFETPQDPDNPPPPCDPFNPPPYCVITPINPPGDADVTVRKRAEMHQVQRGDAVPYVITVTNNAANSGVTLTVTDRIPAGFRYIADTATIDGVAATPTIAGRTLSFPGVVFAPGQEREIRLRLLVLSTVTPGTHVNYANALDPDGDPVGPDAPAEVVVLAEAIFDCSEVIGKVFDDSNHNGYQDPGELGLPGVRLATVNGNLIITDKHGRYHVPCAMLPDQRIGSNFILKLDTRTLPTGYRLTTENPRVVRLTAGNMTKLNFGAAIGRVVRLDLNDQAFEGTSLKLKPQWLSQLPQLIRILTEEPSLVRLSYIDSHADKTLATQRLRALQKEISSLWARKGGPYRLEFEKIVEIGQ